MAAKIVAVFTLFHPDREIVEKLIENCLEYPGCDVFLSDNADYSSEIFNHPRVTYCNNGQNIGLGAAQNKGLKVALEKKYDYAIIFDQDSRIEPDFLERLIREFECAREKDPKIIAGGPSIINPLFVKARKSKRKSIPQNRYRKTVIASGCILYVPELNNVGLMDEMLFIDYVDTEFCHRVRSKGYQVMRLAHVVMNHTVGECKKIGWMKLRYHHHSRYYYFFRNGIILFRKKCITLRELLENRQHLYKILFLDHRWECIKLVFKGVWDGLTIKLC
jgi:rhamnosyltransferase